jgi:hypothetical protein
VLAAAGAVKLLYSGLLHPYFLSPLRHLPHPEVSTLALPGPALDIYAEVIPHGNSLLMDQWRRISNSPLGEPPKEWINTVENHGLVRYLSFFNQERILVTRSESLRELMYEQSYNFIKPPLTFAGIGRILAMDSYLRREMSTR